LLFTVDEILPRRVHGVSIGNEIKPRTPDAPYDSPPTYLDTFESKCPLFSAGTFPHIHLLSNFDMLVVGEIDVFYE
jgi:hypothetical protein